MENGLVNSIIYVQPITFLVNHSIQQYCDKVSLLWTYLGNHHVPWLR